MREGSVELRYTKQAEADFREKVPRLARPLWSATLRDQVVSWSAYQTKELPASVLPAVLMNQDVQPLSPKGKTGDQPRLFVVPVGSFSAVVQPVEKDGLVEGARVERILNEKDVEGILKNTTSKVLPSIFGKD
jgi:hypothetical protein